MAERKKKVEWENFANKIKKKRISGEKINH